MAKNGKKASRAPAGEKPKACYVLSLSVENVRCFGPKQTLDLSNGHGRPAPWTIILGENGTGKTTLLQALVGFESLPDERGDVFAGVDSDHFAPYFLRMHPLERWLRGSGDNRRIVAHSTVNFAYSDDGIAGPFESEQTASIRVNLPGHTRWRPDVFPPHFFAFGANRRPVRGDNSTPTSDDPVVTLFDPTARVRNAEEWLLRLDYAASKPSSGKVEYKERREQVTELLCSGLLPGVYELRFVTEGDVYPSSSAEFLTDYGWVPLSQLGYGYQTLIAWMLDFVSRLVERYPKSDDPLGEPAICVVDEIDLHLHPAWQRKLIGFLSERFPNTQFIATAHSPLVVQAAENANIAVLKREGDHVVIDNDVDDIRNWRVDQILTSDLFGLESARSPRVERILKRQEQLAGKARLTLAEKKELKELQDQIDRLPVGRSAAENEELAAIRQALDALRATSPK